jgi:uncharacterized membrane protein
MIQMTLYARQDDPIRSELRSMLLPLAKDFAFELHYVDIEKEPVLQETFSEKAPVLDVGVFRLQKSFNRDDIAFALGKAQEKLDEAQAKGNDVMVRRISQPMRSTKSDRFSHWFSNHYMVLLNLFTGLYLLLTFLAPIFMKVGWQRPAKVIYRVYSPLCHQLAFRSFFLFGEQLYYPRELAGVEGVLTYGQATGLDEYNIPQARAYIGDEIVGYKIAFCQRDIAIYGLIFLFGIVFSLTGKRIKPLPWYLWILLGLGPIGLDGFSQLLSQTGLAIFSWLPLRESTPLLRVFTGGMFGLATAWFGFPNLEESVQESRYEMTLKHAIIRQLGDQEAETFST